MQNAVNVYFSSMRLHLFAYTLQTPVIAYFSSRQLQLLAFKRQNRGSFFIPTLLEGIQ